MKNKYQALLFALLFITFGCSKDEVPNQIGTWEGVQYQTIKSNGVIASETTTDMELSLLESGSGFLTRTFGLNGEIHWVLDEVESVIYIIKDIEISTGSVLSSTDRYDIIENTNSEQKWEFDQNYESPTGEATEIFTRWTLMKK